MDWSYIISNWHWHIDAAKRLMSVRWLCPSAYWQGLLKQRILLAASKRTIFVSNKHSCFVIHRANHSNKYRTCHNVYLWHVWEEVVDLTTCNAHAQASKWLKPTPHIHHTCAQTHTWAKHTGLPVPHLYLHLSFDTYPQQTL
jgi:hypothetical protein